MNLIFNITPSQVTPWINKEGFKGRKNKTTKGAFGTARLSKAKKNLKRNK